MAWWGLSSSTWCLIIAFHWRGFGVGDGGQIERVEQAIQAKKERMGRNVGATFSTSYDPCLRPLRANVSFGKAVK